MSSMSAASSENRKDSAGSRVKKKARCHEASVTLPPVCTESPSLSGALAVRPLFSPTSVLRSGPSDRPSSVVELPRLIALKGPGRATDDTKRTEGPQPMTSASGTHIPLRAAEECTAQRYMDFDFGVPDYPNTFSKDSLSSLCEMQGRGKRF